MFLVYMAGSNCFQLHLVCCFNLLKVPSSTSVDLMWQGMKSSKEEFLIPAILPRKRYTQHTSREEKNLIVKSLDQAMYLASLGNSVTEAETKSNSPWLSSICRNLPSFPHVLSHFDEANEAGLHTSKLAFSLERGQRIQQVKGSLEQLIIS